MPDIDLSAGFLPDDPNKNVLKDPRVRIMLDTIGRSEGADYNTLVGGRKIDDLSHHPNVVGLRTSAGPSTAFGRYQITGTTNKTKLKKYSNLDYSPENQDLRAVELLRRTGALDALEADDPATAIKRAGSEWASLPGSPLPGRKQPLGPMLRRFGGGTPPIDLPEIDLSSGFVDAPTETTNQDPQVNELAQVGAQAKGLDQPAEIQPGLRGLGSTPPKPSITDALTTLTRNVQRETEKLTKKLPKAPETIDAGPGYSQSSGLITREPQNVMSARQPGIIERIKETVGPYVPGLSTLDTAFGPKTDPIRGAASGITLGAVGDPRQVSREEAIVDPEAQQKADFSHAAGEVLGQVVPYVGAESLLARGIKGTTLLPRAIRTAATFGGVEAGKQAVNKARGREVNLKSIPESALLGAVTAGLAGEDPAIIRRVAAYVAPTVAADVAKGTPLDQAVKGALINTGFALVGGGGKPEGETMSGRGRLTPEARALVDQARSDVSQAVNTPRVIERPTIPEAQQNALRASAMQETLAPVANAPKIDPALREVPPVSRIESAPTEAPKLNRWQHRDFGLVTESTDQSRVSTGKVRVLDQEGVEHVIQRVNGRGAGNQIAVPVRETKDLPFKVIDRRSSAQPAEPATPEAAPAEVASTPRKEVIQSESTQKGEQDAAKLNTASIEAPRPSTGAATAPVLTREPDAPEIVGYHGSPHKIESDYRPASGGELGPGLYFSKDPKVAEGYTWNEERQPQGSPVTLKGLGIRLKNLTKEEFLKDRAGYFDREHDALKAKGEEWDANAFDRGVRKMTDKYLSMGFDGYYVEGEQQGVIFPESLAKLERPSSGKVAPPVITRDRAFPKSAEAAGLPQATDLTYAINTDIGATDRANQRIKEHGIDRVISDLQKSEGSKDDIVAGSIIAHQLTEKGDLTRAVDLVDDMARKLTNAGQTVEAASLIARLSPEGVLMAAQKRMPGDVKLKPEVAKILVEHATKVREAEARVATLEDQIAKLKQDSGAVPVTRAGARQRIETLQDRLGKMEQEARARLAERVGVGKGGQTGASTIPLDLADFAIIGAAKLARKGITLAQWTNEMISEFGDGIKPHLKAIYADAYKHYDEQRKTLNQAKLERGARKAQPNAIDIQAVINQRTEAQKVAQKAQRNLASAFQEITRSKPEKVLSSVTDLRRANLLTAAKTHIRNITSNIGFQGSEALSRPMAAMADMVAKHAKGTGIRTTTGMDIPAEARAVIKAAVTEGPRRAADLILGREVLPLEGYGKQKESLGSKMQLGESDTGIKLLDTYVNTVFRTLEAEDAIFKVYAFGRELSDIAKSQALTERSQNKSISVSQRAKELRANPTDAMLLEASAYADYATFQNDNRVSSAIRGGKKLIGPVGKFAVETIAPFDRTPTNIIYRAFENSPLGLISAANKFRNIGNPRGRTLSGAKTPRAENRAPSAIADAAFTRAEQKDFARTFGRASTGTALAALSLVLAQKGLLVGTADYNDNKEGYFTKRRLYGGGGRIRIPYTDQWITITDTPVGKAMATVAALYEIMNEKKKSGETSTDLRNRKVTESLKSVGRVALDQPLASASQDLLSNKSVAETAGSYVGSMIPGSAALTSIGDTLDPEARKTFGEGFSAQIQKAIPAGPYSRRQLPINRGIDRGERGTIIRRTMRAFDPFATTTQGKGPKTIKR